MIKLRLTGDSHTAALTGALMEMAKNGQIPAEIDVKSRVLDAGNNFHHPFFTPEQGIVRLTGDTAREQFRLLTGKDYLERADGTIYGLSMGFQSPRVFRDTVWRQFAPWRVAAAAGLAPLSDEAAAFAFEENDRFIFDFIDALRAAGVPCFVIPAPPPRAGHYCMRDGGTRPEVVLEVDRMFRQWVAGQLDQRGVAYVRIPAQATGKDGFLKPEFEPADPKDPHHANVAYGKLMVRRILDFVKDLPAAPPEGDLFQPAE